jgi:hypothetical protein
MLFLSICRRVWRIAVDLDIGQPAAENRTRRSRGIMVRTGRDAVIRQAISCDICASEKQQTNHWFVAFEQAGELRLNPWNSRNRLRPGSKHLCGQTCLHKLVDEFMARALSVRVQPASADEAEVEVQVEPHLPERSQAKFQPRPEARAAAIDSSLTSNAAHDRLDKSDRFDQVESSARLLTPYEEVESSARLLPEAMPVMPIRLPPKAKAELAVLPGRPEAAKVMEQVAAPPDEPPHFASRNWHAEAWDRERAREQRTVQRRSDAAPRRRSGS